MIPTPDLAHLTKQDYDVVYEPAEDTFILLDALEADAEVLRAIKTPICLEIGSGSGCVSAFLGVILGADAVYLCTDINPHAALCTLRTGAQNKVALSPVIASLASPFAQRLRRKIDVLVFNPPYVPTSADEVLDAQDAGGIAGAWAGGKDGMRVTNVLLGMLDDLLAPEGRFYLVALKQNDIPGITRRLREEQRMDCKIVLQRRAGREHLHVLCITRL
ncbi:putative methylase [Exidia glandulosa HHB12029]|uniref:Putative methylase n=1 Tax=Exidia glandulosa HHB12029 TaxID=1314781 RepID=A0A165PT89_EXIGL|nr:putative methylase [Exidia glandulosa HHB12029]